MGKESKVGNDPIRIGQRFPVFPAGETYGFPSKIEPEVFWSQRVLRTGLIPQTPIIFDLLRLPTEGGLKLYPFSPKFGYQIDERDFDPNTRTQKIAEICSRAENDFAYYSLSVRSQEPYALESDAAALDIVRRLRLQLFFPNLEDTLEDTYEGGPNNLMALSDYELYFENFYPLKTGPLPDPYHIDNSDFLDYIHGGGNWIGVRPEDLELIHILEGKFILTSESSKLAIPSVFQRAFPPGAF